MRTKTDKKQKILDYSRNLNVKAVVRLIQFMHTWEYHCSALGSVLQEDELEELPWELGRGCKDIDGIFHAFCFTASVFTFIK